MLPTPEIDAELDADVIPTAEPAPVPPQPLQVASLTAGSESIRNRIAAHVKTLRWQDPDADLKAPIPLDDLAAAVAADEQVSAWIADWQANADPAVAGQVERACASLPDSEIVRVVGPALKRLEG